MGAAAIVAYWVHALPQLRGTDAASQLTVVGTVPLKSA
jgi:hypothetical protein